MLTAKVFENGRSQAVRLPKEYRFKDSEVFANKIGDVVMLMPKNEEWESFLLGLSLLGDDFMPDGRNQGSFDVREAL